jgi:hypothetical protein
VHEALFLEFEFVAILLFGSDAGVVRVDYLNYAGHILYCELSKVTFFRDSNLAKNPFSFLETGLE